MCNALNEMKQKSMIEGRAEGGNLMIYSLVQDLLLTPEVGSKHLGITKVCKKEGLFLIHIFLHRTDF